MDNDRELKRLCALYEEKGDGELLDLHERRDDLTPLAQQALEQVMRERRLEPEAAEAQAGAEEPGGADAEGEGLPIGEDEAPLWFFQDGFQMSSATKALEEAGVEYRVLDPSLTEAYRRQDGRSMGLQMVVAKADLERAKSVLRKAVGLFPLPEVEGDEHAVDGYAVVGVFDREDALLVAKTLGEQGFSFLWEDWMEKADAEETGVSISVKSARQDEAVEVVEKVFREQGVGNRE